MRTVHAIVAAFVATTASAAWSTALADEAAPAAPRTLQHIHASGDFIDDPFALSDDGTRLAWITTDGATHAELHVATVGDDKSERKFPYSSITPERVQFLDAERVLVVDRHPTTRFTRAEVFGPKGSLGKFGPANEVGVGTAGGVPSLVTWMKATSPEGAKHTFTAWRLDNLKPLAKKVLVENREGRVPFAGSLYKPLYFLDGFGTLVGQKEGAYDKKKDIRRPDLAARADLFAGKLLEEKEIKDVVAYAEFTNLRKLHNNETHFVYFSPDRTVLSHVGPELFASEAVTALNVPRPLRKYDAETLLYRPMPDGSVTFSLTVDTVNAEAVKAQKADKDWLDLYSLDVKSHALTQVLRLDGQGRPSTWFLAGNRMALLRKHKGFGRGGGDLDVLELGPEKPKAAPANAVKEPAPAKASDGDKGAAPASAPSAGGKGGGKETKAAK